jgi:hypothetical protein
MKNIKNTDAPGHCTGLSLRAGHPGGERMPPSDGPPQALRAPMAVRLHLVPSYLSLIQFCLLPPMLCSSEGRSFLFRINTSMPLLKQRRT